jgi:lambda family phage portal protein
MDLSKWFHGRSVTAAPQVPHLPDTYREGRRVRGLRAGYDAARNTEENRRWWANADDLSPARANSADVRKVLRRRSRYEVANNSYARGIVSTLANDVVGVGPQLQLFTPDAAANRRVEAAFAAWAKEVGLAEKFRTAKLAKTGDGESLLILTTNRRLSAPVKLDIKPVEADLLAAPQSAPGDPYDGIEYDADGNPAAYWIAREHPGDGHAYPLEADRLPASEVIHWFRADRPGQLRGVPEITPALDLFAQLRRYTLAVIAAAETAADFAAVLQSDAPPDGADMADPFDTLEIERRMMTTMPAGWKMSQFKAEQPATTYEMFKRELLGEIARCLNVPYNVAAGNSSSYNYASGRLDHQTYHKSVRVEQSHCEAVALTRLFMAWLDEAALIPGLIPDGMPPFSDWGVAWLWPGWEHVDPAKEAGAQAARLASRTTSYAEELGRRGLDWESHFEQVAKEKARMAELGITPADEMPQPAEPAPEEEEAAADG